MSSLDLINSEFWQPLCDVLRWVVLEGYLLIIVTQRRPGTKHARVEQAGSAGVHPSLQERIVASHEGGICRLSAPSSTVFPSISYHART